MNPTLYVQTFGGFALTYEERMLPVENSGNTKMMHLLLDILLAGDKGVDRTFLIEDLYYDEPVYEKAVGKLRVVLFRLRKYLSENGLCGDQCILKKGGILQWDSSFVPVEIDLFRFVEGYREVLENRDFFSPREEKLRELCLLYKGRFLPSMTDCDWIVREREDLQRKYQSCKKMLEEMPGNQVQPDSSIGMEEFGIVREFMRNGEGAGGACYCVKSSFFDACRITKERIRRLGGTANLMLCKMSCLQEDNGMEILQACDQMRTAAGVLRKSDFYTDLGKGTFMFLLTGVTAKPIDCGRTRERLEDAFWHDFGDQNVNLQFAYEAL